MKYERAAAFYHGPLRGPRQLSYSGIGLGDDVIRKGREQRPEMRNFALPGASSLCLSSISMPRKYSKKAGRKIHKVMREYKSGKLKSGRSGKKVKSRKQAIAIGISEARREGDKVPARKK
jgi:hypothetical protein